MLIRCFVITCLWAQGLHADLMQQEIKHVVVLMLENRSFDHLLGWLYSKEAPKHFIGSSLPYQGLTKGTAYTNVLRDSSGNIVFSSPPIQGTPSLAGSKLINSPAYNPNEPFDNVTQQIYNGTNAPSMLGFLQDYASLWDEEDWKDDEQSICAIMESYTELPVFHALAREYAVSDSWFSSVPTQTNPNRAFLLCGTSEGQIVNSPSGENTFTSDTIWNRLEQEAPGTSWTVFWQSDMIPGIYPGPWDSPQVFSALNSIKNLESHYQKIDDFHRLARNGELPEFSFIEPQWTFCEGIELEDLQTDYPDSPYLVGIQGNDFHPPGDIRTAENLLANIYASLIANPEAWEKTLLVVLFDEHGGIFDHVSPPTSLAPDDHFENGFTFNRYGVRTPALFISPRIKKGTVLRPQGSLYPFDHTSFLATLLKWKHIEPKQWNMGNRVAAAPTFETVITETTPRRDALIAGNQSLTMQDLISLKDPQGNYLAVSSCGNYATTSSNSTFFQFTPGSGKITHGSFVTLQWENDLLDAGSLTGDCYFDTNDHRISQWWTIKSVDHPHLGYEIQNGDRVYLENHIYLNPLNFVPSRLTSIQSLFFFTSITTKPITEEGADNCYWMIEKK